MAKATEELLISVNWQKQQTKLTDLEEQFNMSNTSSDRDLELLLAGGAAADVKTNEGFTPLQTAAQKGHSAVAALLRRQGAYSGEL